MLQLKKVKKRVHSINVLSKILPPRFRKKQKDKFPNNKNITYLCRTRLTQIGI